MDTKEKIDHSLMLVSTLRIRAKVARMKANIALVLVFVIIFSGISLFYFAGDIVIREAEPVKSYLRPPTN